MQAEVATRARGEGPALLRMVVRGAQGDRYRWVLAEDGVASPERTGTLEALSSEWRSMAQPAVWLLLPATAAPLRRLPLSARDARRLDAGIGYLLEDDLLADIDTLHIAATWPSADEALLTVVEADWLRGVLQPFEAAGIRVDVCTPEQCVLAGQGTALLWTDGDTLIWRGGESEPLRAIAVEGAEHVPALLALAAGDAMPLRCLVEGDTGKVTSLLPQGAAQEFHEASLLSLAAACSASSVINVLQGRFAPRIPWSAVWKRSRAAAAAIAVALLVHLGYTLLALQASTRAQAGLQAEIERVYRTVQPGGQLVDAAVQLRTLLRRGQRDGGGAAVTGMFYPIGEVLSAHPDTGLRALRFDAGSRAFQLEVAAPSHQSIETLLASLRSAGQDAALESSAASDAGVRSRLVVR